MIFILSCLAIVILTSCAANDGPSVEIGEAHWDGSVLVVPGASIYVGGEVAEGRLGVSDRALVGVELNGEFFFLFTSSDVSGEVLTLSDEVTRTSIASFVGWTFAEEDSVGGAATTGWTGRSGIDVVPHSSATLSTGLFVDGLPEDEVVHGSDRYDFSNRRSRLAAVMPDSSGTPTFLLSRRLVGVEYAAIFFSELGPAIRFKDTHQASFAADIRFQTFGAITRAWAFPPAYAVLPLKPTILEGFAADPTLYMQLNAVDLLYVVLEGIDAVVGLLPLDQCLSPIIKPVIAAFESGGLALLGMDVDAMRVLSADLEEKVQFELGLCAATVYTGGALEAVTSFLSVVSALDWAGHAVVGGIDVVRSSAYNVLEVGTWAPDRNVSLVTRGASTGDNGHFEDGVHTPGPSSNLIDGDDSTYWAGLASVSPQMAWINFDKEYEIDEIIIEELDVAYTNTGVLEYYDGSAWQHLASIDKSSAGFAITFPAVRASGVRLSIHSSTAPGGWYNKVACVFAIKALAVDPG